MPLRRLQPPSGDPAPVSVTTDSGESIDLLALAEETCRRYRQVFPDELDRYGPAGEAWCVHDTSYLLAWAVDSADGRMVMRTEVAWLARVLESRSFPLERLSRNLELAAEVVREQVGSPAARRTARVLAREASYVRSQETFLD